LQQCANSSITVGKGGDSYLWRLEALVEDDNMLTQRARQEDSGGWRCQHALAHAANLIVETWACGYSLENEGAAVAAAMITNAAKK
jgi:PknH-like protein